MMKAGNSQIMRTISLLITIFSLSLPAYAQYSGGTGEPNDPYQIATAEDLMLLGDSPEDYDKHFILTADIDLDPNLPGRKVFDRAVIDTFTGIFDGNGHVISNLWIKGFIHLGLFGQLASGAKISNLGLESADVEGTGWYVGGLVGENYGSITTSYSTGIVTGVYEVGGLVGRNSAGSITTNYSTGAVTGGWSVGGLVGGNWNGSITTSYSTGMVTGNEDVGGLVGNNYNGSITLSFWDIEISGQTASAGGTGNTTAEMQMADTFLNAGWDFVDETANGTEDRWKISEGLDYPRLRREKYGGGTGEPNDPYLIYTAEYLNELGAERNDYNKHFKLMADIDFSGYLYERAVIAPDMNDSGLQHEGIPFTGVLDGNGHVISNLTIEGHSLLGLFGYLDGDAIVSNLSIEAADVNGISDFVGSLAGFNYGNVIGCCCTGDVSGNDDVGGLVGSNTIGGNITNCYSTVTVNGNEKVGGLVGYTKGNITMCYSTGMVISEGQNAGGLVGERNPSYGIVTDCFWDTQTSDQATSAGGTGKTTTEMQTENTFTDAGWDFVDETENGSEDIWWILKGQDYPRLWWEAD